MWPGTEGDSLQEARTAEAGGSNIGGLLALAASAFGVFGLWAGLSAVLLANLGRSVGLSPGPLGVALFAGAASSMVAMWSLGWTVDRFGRRSYLVTVTCVFGIGVSGLAAVGTFATLVAAFAILYAAAYRIYDVGINAVAVDLEGLSGRRLMSFLHAGYAVGAVAGALAAAGMAVALLTPRPALVVAGFLLVGLAISGMAPLAQSMAGDLFPDRAGAAVSVVITFGSGGGLLATVVVGGAAEAAGLRTALGLVVAAGLAVFALSPHREKGGRSG